MGQSFFKSQGTLQGHRKWGWEKINIFFSLTGCKGKTRVSKSDVSTQIPDLLTMKPAQLWVKGLTSQTIAH